MSRSDVVRLMAANFLSKLERCDCGVSLPLGRSPPVRHRGYRFDVHPREFGPPDPRKDASARFNECLDRHLENTMRVMHPRYVEQKVNLASFTETSIGYIIDLSLY